MKVYLLRHGIAVPYGTHGVHSDEERMLSPEGVEKTRLAAEGLSKLDCSPQRIISSPLVRAVETSAIAAKNIAPQVKIEQQPFLVPMADPQLALKWLARQKPEDMMFVGHLPHLPLFAAAALCKGPVLDIVIKKASVVCLEFQYGISPGSASLVYLLQPKQLRLCAHNPAG